MFCDKCGEAIDRLSDRWGNCTVCGQDLCMKCAGHFDDEGACEDCQKLIAELNEEEKR